MDQQLDSARDNTLTETNAQTIFENLRKLREFYAVHRRRWIWELLQNAVDATDPSTGRNRVSIQAEQKKIRFSHNGSAFSPEEISHLIYHGSTKQEDPTKKGKFGTGFLAVHLVSRKVRIRGTLKVNGLSSDFEFLLDRSGDTPRAIQHNMTEAWASFKNSRRDTGGTRSYTTAFECDLDADAGAVVQDGLADLAKTVPYVLAFIDKLEEVKVRDDSGATSWRTVERHSLGDLTEIEVVCEKAGRPPEVVRIAVVGNHASGVALAVLLRRAGERWELVSDDSTPRLFYPLPLVDTQDLSVPFAIISDGLEPTEERNGILASAAGEKADLTEKNWKLLSQVPPLFGKLVEACCREGWLAPHKLAEFRPVPAKDWLDGNRFTSKVVAVAVASIRSNTAARLVRVPDGLLPVAESAIPINDPDGKIHSLASELGAFKGKLPTREVAGDWARILGGWAAILGKSVEQLSEALTAPKLADEIAPLKTVHDLSEKLSSGTAKSALRWLNRLFESVPADNLRAFVSNRCILPNQQWNFRKDGELRLDAGIEKTIKVVCEKLGDSVRSKLLRKRISPAVRQLFENVAGRSLSKARAPRR